MNSQANKNQCEQCEKLSRLDICGAWGCWKPFSQGEEYQALVRDGKDIMSFHLTCWSKYSDVKKKWEK